MRAPGKKRFELARFIVNSGRLKGRVLEAPIETWETRPTTGRVRQSVINMLRPTLPGAVFVDLFAGTGLMGIHALSEGAKEVWWIEENARLTKALHATLAAWGEEGSRVLTGMLPGALSVLANNGVRATHVYMDPPFGQDPAPVFQHLPAILAPDGRVFLECGRPLDEIPVNFGLQQSRRWGKIALQEFRLCDTP